ncbi:hypothetical protein BOO86_17045 [Mycobacterium sp. CBMA 234]|nr:hypothetical protein [Mycolicibacterium sp. CBMA 234]
MPVVSANVQLTAASLPDPGQLLGELLSGQFITNLPFLLSQPLAAVDGVLYDLTRQGGPLVVSALATVLGPLATTPPVAAALAAIETYSQNAILPPSSFVGTSLGGLDPITLALMVFNAATQPVNALFPAAQAFLQVLTGASAGPAAAVAPNVAAAVVPNTTATPAAGLDPVGLIQQVLAILPMAVAHLQQGNLVALAADPIMAVDTVLYGAAQQGGAVVNSVLDTVLAPVATTPPAKALMAAVQTYFKNAANPPTFAWSGGFGINPFSLAAVTFNDFTAPVFALLPAAQAFVNGLTGAGATSAAATVPKVQTNVLKLPTPTSATTPDGGAPKTLSKSTKTVASPPTSAGAGADDGTDTKAPSDSGKPASHGKDHSKKDNPGAKDDSGTKDPAAKDPSHNRGNTHENAGGKDTSSTSTTSKHENTGGQHGDHAGK